MGLIKITFDSASVTSKLDADLNHFLAANQNGVISGLLNACTASTTNNYIIFQSGYVQAYGRRVFVESGTKISISLDGTAYGYVFIKINLNNNTAELEKREASSSYPSLVQQDLCNGGTVYELPLARYTKTSSSLTLDTSYNVPKISNYSVLAGSKDYDLKNQIIDSYGPKWQGTGTRSSGNTYIFRDITSAHYPGIGSIHVSGTTVVFSMSGVAGSGGIVYYRVNGTDKSLSMQLTSSGLYVEASDGSVPSYVRVIR